MRDFRDAKAMAQALRTALSAMGFKITISQSLELVAKLFGVNDWNTLLAAIRADADARPANAVPPAAPPDSGRMPMFSRTLEAGLHRALAYANERRHEYATLEHLLLALIDEPEAAAAMRACNIHLDELTAELAGHLQHDMTALVTEEGGDRDAVPTAAFQRVIQRAVIHAKEGGHSSTTGADVLAAMLDEGESHAVWLLGEHGVTQRAVRTFTLDGSVRRTSSHARTKPVTVERLKRRGATRSRQQKRKDPE